MTLLGGAEVYHGMNSANHRFRFGPRARWEVGAPCASPGLPLRESPALSFGWRSAITRAESASRLRHGNAPRSTWIGS